METEAERKARFAAMPIDELLKHITVQDYDHCQFCKVPFDELIRRLKQPPSPFPRPNKKVWGTDEQIEEELKNMERDNADEPADGRMSISMYIAWLARIGAEALK